MTQREPKASNDLPSTVERFSVPQAEMPRKTENYPAMEFPFSGALYAKTVPGLVLVVDDQVRNLQLVKTALTRDGFEVITASSGEQALQCLISRIPDLILLDVMMPEMNGFEVCKQIKENPLTREIPVIFLSGDANHQSITTGFDCGGIDYITKPFNKPELLARVRTQVELRRAHQRHAAQLSVKNRMLGIIANKWHKPLQRIAFITAKLEELVTDPGSTLAAEATEEAERMLASIEGFLQQQSLDDNDQFVPQPASQLTSDDLKTIAGQWYVSAKRKSIDFMITAPSSPITVMAAPFAVNHVIDPILANAIAYTPNEGRVVVQIIHDGSNVHLEVTDEGSGFPEAYFARQFQPYVKPAANRTQGSNALGIGLAAAKRAADRIGASISIANRATVGAKVRVTFNACQANGS